MESGLFNGLKADSNEKISPFPRFAPRVVVRSVFKQPHPYVIRRRQAASEEVLLIENDMLYFRFLSREVAILMAVAVGSSFVNPLWMPPPVMAGLVPAIHAPPTPRGVRHTLSGRKTHKSKGFACLPSGTSPTMTPSGRPASLSAPPWSVRAPRVSWLRPRALPAGGSGQGRAPRNRTGPFRRWKISPASVAGLFHAPQRRSMRSRKVE